MQIQNTVSFQEPGLRRVASQGDMAFEVMQGLSRPALAEEIDAAVRAHYPDAHIASGSINSVLCAMARDGRIRSAYDLFNGIPRKFYSLSDGVPVAAAAVVPLMAPQMCQVSLDVSPSLHEALYAIAIARGLCSVDTGDAGVRMVIHEALVAFLTSDAHRRPGFFWCKFERGDRHFVGVRYRFSDERVMARDCVRRLRHEADSSRLDIATTKRAHPFRALFSAQVVWHTALVWYVCSRTSDLEYGLPFVGSFIDQAVKDYVQAGRTVLEAYPRPVSPAGSNASAPAGDEDLRSVTPPAPLAALQSSPGSLTISIPIAIAPEWTERILDVVRQALKESG